jgi:ribosomal protein S18 acetylase RimI-like enzyme
VPTLFADYEPESSGIPVDLDVVPMGAAHLDRCAGIAAQREGGPLEQWRESLERGLAAADRLSWVALVDGEVAGYASVGRLNPRVGDPGGVAPEGWYLTGVVVDPARRRRGVGSRLTRVRLAWLAGRTDQVWYFVSALNRASIDLHAGFGFRLVARGVSFPGVTVSGEALLYVADLAPASLR